MKHKILIVDDEKPTRDVMARVLAAKYTCLTAPDAEIALKTIDDNPDLAVLITDYKMEPGDNGITLIQKAKARRPALGCILITAFGEIELAVEAMKRGANDFLAKPITDIDQLELRVAKALPAELERPAAATPTDALSTFIGQSPAMQRVYQLIRKVAPTNANVLIEGPSGTGKELVAHAVHALSPRAAKPFVAVECAALSPTLLESELFGHEKGSFTDAHERKIGRFEAAQGGTLFLDEIGEIDLATQVKLLRALETRTIQRVGGTTDIPVDFRLVTATNKDLLELVRQNKFREDLYYRLNVIDIPMPPLRARPGDIPLLVTHFLEILAKQNGLKPMSAEPEVVRALEAYAWPGNVRQLRNVLEKMLVLSSGSVLTPADLPPEITMPTTNDDTTARAAATPTVETPARRAPIPGQSLAEAEKEQILAALAAARGNKSRAAEALGISRRTLHRKLTEWNLS